MLEYELVDANGGIQKVRVEPATRSAVATCNQTKKMFVCTGSKAIHRPTQKIWADTLKWAENGYKERATATTQNGNTDKHYITNTLNGQQLTTHTGRQT